MKLAFVFLGTGLTISVVLTLLIGVYIKDGRNGKEQSIAGWLLLLSSVIGSVGTFMCVAYSSGYYILLFILVFLPFSIFGFVRGLLCKDGDIVQNDSVSMSAAQQRPQKINVKRKYASQLTEDSDELKKYQKYCLDAFDDYEADNATSDRVEKFVADVYARIVTLDDQEKTLSAALSIYKNEARKRRRILGSLITIVVIVGMSVTIGVSCNSKGGRLVYELNNTGYTVSADENYKETNIVIPETYKDKKVTKIADFAFRYIKNQKNIKSITIPDSVTSIGERAFYGCSGLTSITIPDSVIYIDSWAFYGCSGLTNVTIPVGASVGDGLFAGCPLETVSLPTSAISGIDSNAKSIKTVVLTGGTTIKENAFVGFNNLTSVTIPSSVTSIGVSAFSGCTGLDRVYIEDLTAWCKIGFGNILSNPLGYAHNLYVNGRLVTKLMLSSGVNIKNYAFYGCSSLTSVIIPAYTTSIGASAFSECSGLTSVTINSGIKSIGDNAFYNCKNLSSVTIPESVTSIGSGAFSSSGLSGIVIPANVISIGAGAFRDCYRLKSVWWNAKTCSDVGRPISYIFKGCNIDTIYIGKNVELLPQYAFYAGCTSNVSIHYSGTIFQWGTIPKGNYWKPSQSINVVCLDGQTVC